MKRAACSKQRKDRVEFKKACGRHDRWSLGLTFLNVRHLYEATSGEIWDYVYVEAGAELLIEGRCDARETLFLHGVIRPFRRPPSAEGRSPLGDVLHGVAYLRRRLGHVDRAGGSE